jgi:hypothetical protein
MLQLKLFVKDRILQAYTGFRTDECPTGQCYPLIALAADFHMMRYPNALPQRTAQSFDTGKNWSYNTYAS